MKKLSTYTLLSACLLALTFSFTSCKKEGCTDAQATNYDEKAKDDDGSCQYDTPPTTSTMPVTTDLTEVGKGYAVGAETEIKVYAKEALFNGYNYLYIATFDSASGKWMNDGHVTLEPVMDMGHMSHGTPVENPSSSTPDSKTGLYAAQVVFVMPSMGGTWMLKVHYHNHDNGKEGEAMIPITVASASNRLVQSFVAADDSSRIFVSYVLPSAPMVGVNDMEVTAHYRKNMMEHEALTDLEIEITPDMPSMGHGSPNNVHPTHTSQGHYVGKVNYTMTGLWRITLVVKRNGQVIGENIWFEYTL
ncbi:FixH family protein [bacterium SCSIO 12741]|nr:FixH family protein [bacterium SCSIO 12741]